MRPAATLTDSRAGDDGAIAEPASPPGLAARYRIEGELARGGGGCVWRAHDLALDRTVAIKQPVRRGDAADARFHREARITARLQHPSIVPVYEAGTLADGAPFYAMKLVEGEPLRDRIARATDRIALVPHLVAVTDAVAYAHARGVVHRDLSPANVVCGAHGETIVVDWGLAHLVGEAPRAGVGTSGYIAPEQADGAAIDPRADVFSIGAMLRELTGGAAPPELRAIAARACAPRPDDRYASAAALGDDLRRFIAGRLVSAHAYSRADRIGRWVRRHRALVALGAVAAACVALVGAIAVARVVAERDAADARADALVLAQARSSLDRDPAASLAWLKRYRDGASDAAGARAIALDALSRLPARHVWRHGGPVGAVAASRSGRWLATAGGELSVEVHDALGGGLVARFATEAAVSALAFAPDERTLIGADLGGGVHVWDLATRDARTVRVPGGALLAVALDGDSIVAGGAAGSLAIVDRRTLAVRTLAPSPAPARIAALAVADGRAIAGDAAGVVASCALAPGGSCTVIARHGGAVNDLAIDGGDIVSVADDATLLRTAAGGARRDVLPRPAVVLARGADGTLAVADEAGRIAVHAREGRTRWLEVPGAAAEPSAIAVSPDGASVAAGLLDGRVVAWDAASGTARELAHHGAGVVHVAFASNGALVAAGADGVARAWASVAGDGTAVARPSAVVYLAAARDGAVALAEARGEVEWLDGGDARALAQLDAPSAIAISDDGADVWAAGWDGTLRHLRPRGPAEILARDLGIVRSIAVRGTEIAAAGSTGLRRFDRDGAHALAGHTGDVRAVAALPDGRWLSGGTDRTLRLWTGDASRVLETAPGEVYLVAVSPDGALAASVTLAGARLWRTADWTARPLAIPAQVRAIAFSPDGALLAATTIGAPIAVWDTRTAARRDLAGPGAGSNRIAFAPAAATTDPRFATTGVDGTVRVWSPATGLDRIAHRFAAEAYDIAWTPAGLVASSADRTVWRAPAADARPIPADYRALLDATTAVIAP